MYNNQINFLLSITDEVAEWLRRWTANPLGSARVGSNPILVVIFYTHIPIEYVVTTPCIILSCYCCSCCCWWWGIYLFNIFTSSSSFAAANTITDNDTDAADGDNDDSHHIDLDVRLVQSSTTSHNIVRLRGYILHVVQSMHVCI